MSIKPIETEYGGFLFRSRLEARWAVFFDAVGIKYRYEPEGFELGEGVRYLPDFHLPEGIYIKGESSRRYDVWVEVKPSPELEEKDRQKLAEFAKQTDHVVILLAGDPHEETPIRFISYGNTWYAPLVKWNETSSGKVGLALENEISVLGKKIKDGFATASKARFEGSRKTKKCDICGQPFQPLQGWHKYCFNCYSNQIQTGSEKESGTQQSVITPIQQQSPPPPLTNTKKHPLTPSYTTVLIFILLLGIGSIAVMLSSVNSGTNNEPVVSATSTPRRIDNTPRPTTNLSTDNRNRSCTCTTNRYNCSDFDTQQEAQSCFDQCLSETNEDIHFLDSDGDDEVCELLP